MTHKGWENEREIHVKNAGNVQYVHSRFPNASIGIWEARRSVLTAKVKLLWENAPTLRRREGQELTERREGRVFNNSI